MSRRFAALKPLVGDQALAADPRVHAALSASAGTGKTQVLTARVFRLLLAGVRPETILCLTFTKAGAAEMANRIGARLAAWVRMKDADLRKELFALGEPTDPATLDRARRLFASVLDAPGGLRIQTIHAFAQSLLAAFPAEAEIVPGLQPLEGRAERELARRTLADLVADAERIGNTALIDDVAALSMRLGEGAAESYLLECAGHAEELDALGSAAEIEPALRRAVGLPEGDIAEAIAGWCDDDNFDCALLRSIARANLDWATATGRSHAEAIEAWLALDPPGRAAGLDRLAAVFLTTAGERRKTSSGQSKAMADYDELAGDLAGAIGDLLTMRTAAALVAIQAAGLRAGKAFASAYTRAKRAAGVADFDDLIRWTVRLLEKPGIGEWVRFKLDRRTDHILVDEAQDTNAGQWRIVDALTQEYFSGSSEAEDRWRTLFMVGDFKQAIYSFQGTDPKEFEAARARLRAKVEALTGNPDTPAREFRDLSISASFRSAPAVLQAVDAVIAEVGHEAMGLTERPPDHRAFHAGRPGSVSWWPAFVDDEDDAGDAGEEGWLGEADRCYAGKLAGHVRSLLDSKQVLASTGRAVTPGDVLVLVRSRAELASLIVARLFAEGVPVAGIDRLHLHRPLAVKDLLAAAQFAVQPLDDLNLANLLVSPLVGWSQDDLYDHAARRGKKRLWAVLLDREGEAGAAARALAVLRPLLAMADYATPARFLETILSGPIDGRRKLLARLGPEARDPIEELLSAALEFERNEIASLDRFLAWFASGEVEIKRDPSARVNAVRVMTVHGAKGLEAPIVILADATADPDKLGPVSPPMPFPVHGETVPLVRPRTRERVPPFAALLDDQKVRDRAEHWRLLYVAMTRAEEHLIIAGVAKRTAAEASWHARVEEALLALGAERSEDGSLVHRTSGAPVRARAGRGVAVPPPALPAWLTEPAPAEARPPRPLAPSALGEDPAPFPPPAPGQIDAARRGTLLHRLFERLPGVAEADRHAAALAWLERSAGVEDVAVRRELADAACKTIADPAHAELFGPGSLAEAPIAATLPDGRVIAGTVDRLLVEADRVRLVDFKTGSRVPADAVAIPRAHQLQMEAYRDALQVIFPGRAVSAELLYTAEPRILHVPG